MTCGTTRQSSIIRACQGNRIYSEPTFETFRDKLRSFSTWRASSDKQEKKFQKLWKTLDRDNQKSNIQSAFVSIGNTCCKMR